MSCLYCPLPLALQVSIGKITNTLFGHLQSESGGTHDTYACTLHHKWLQKRLDIRSVGNVTTTSIFDRNYLPMRPALKAVASATIRAKRRARHIMISMVRLGKVVIKRHESGATRFRSSRDYMPTSAHAMMLNFVVLVSLVSVTIGKKK